MPPKYYFADSSARCMSDFGVANVVALVKQAADVVSGAASGLGDAYDHLISRFVRCLCLKTEFVS